jgi:hypothetical protein
MTGRQIRAAGCPGPPWPGMPLRPPAPPRWSASPSPWATAAVLLVGIGISQWAELLFPAWVLALSIDVLVARAGLRPAPYRPGRVTQAHPRWGIVAGLGRP